MTLELITICFDLVTQFSYEIWGYANLRYYTLP